MSTGRRFDPWEVTELLAAGGVVEQFLGPVFSGDRRGVSWAWIGPRSGGGYQVTVHLALDVGDGATTDLGRFPPLDPTAEGTGTVVAVEVDEFTALGVAEGRTDAVVDGWGDATATVEDYRHYVRHARLPHPLGRQDAVEAVQRLLDGDQDDRTVAWRMTGLARQLGCRHLPDLIFWPEEEYAAKAIVDHAFACTPTPLPPGEPRPR